jgi:hypothetical protein
MPKGWKLTSSPYWTRSELFVGVKLWKNYSKDIKRRAFCGADFYKRQEK